jgi:hypothetical protein
MDRSGLTADDLELLRRVDELLQKPKPTERTVVIDIKKLIEQKEADDKETAFHLFQNEFMTFVFALIDAKGKGEREKVFKATLSRIQTGVFVGKELMERIENSWAELMFCFQSFVDKTLAETRVDKDVCTYMRRLRVELDPIPQRRSRRIREMKK